MKFRFTLFAIVIALAAMLIPATTMAQVTITFYSHDFGDRFPHTFITLKGTAPLSGPTSGPISGPPSGAVLGAASVPATVEAVDTSFGFTAKNVSPAILFGSVIGIVETSKPDYIAKSDPQFALVLTVDQYNKIMALVAEWRDRPQKSYNLNKRNCVHFVMEAAALLDLEVNRKSKYFKKPKTFLREVLKLNPQLVALSPETPEKEYKPGKKAAK